MITTLLVSFLSSCGKERGKGVFNLVYRVCQFHNIFFSFSFPGFFLFHPTRAHSNFDYHLFLFIYSIRYASSVLPPSFCSPSCLQSRWCMMRFLHEAESRSCCVRRSGYQHSICQIGSFSDTVTFLFLKRGVERDLLGFRIMLVACLPFFRMASGLCVNGEKHAVQLGFGVRKASTKGRGDKRCCDVEWFIWKKRCERNLSESVDGGRGRSQGGEGVHVYNWLGSLVSVFCSLFSPVSFSAIFVEKVKMLVESKILIYVLKNIQPTYLPTYNLPTYLFISFIVLILHIRSRQLADSLLLVIMLFSSFARYLCQCILYIGLSIAQCISFRPQSLSCFTYTHSTLSHRSIAIHSINS
jgi:hypothetical protein